MAHFREVAERINSRAEERKIEEEFRILKNREMAKKSTSYFTVLRLVSFEIQLNGSKHDCVQIALKLHLKLLRNCLGAKSANQIKRMIRSDFFSITAIAQPD